MTSCLFNKLKENDRIVVNDINLEEIQNSKTMLSTISSHYIKKFERDNYHPEYSIDFRICYRSKILNHDYCSITKTSFYLIICIKSTIEYINGLVIDKERIVNTLVKYVADSNISYNMPSNIFILTDNGFFIRDNLDIKELINLCDILSLLSNIKIIFSILMYENKNKDDSENFSELSIRYN